MNRIILLYQRNEGAEAGKIAFLGGGEKTLREYAIARTGRTQLAFQIGLPALCFP